LKDENPTTARVEFPLNTDCYLAKVEKIELTQQRVARIENFRFLCEIATIKSSSGLYFPQKVQTFRGKRKVWSFLELRFEICNLA